MNIVLFTFSGTGNTWWTVQSFKDLAKKKDIQVEILSIENILDETPLFFTDIYDRADIIGLAYPIYGSSWPHIVRDFTFQLLQHISHHHCSSSDTPKILVLTSMMLFSGDGALVPRRYFKRNGFQVKWAINIPLCSNISIPIFRANPYPIEKIEKNKQKALVKLEQLLDTIIKERPWLEHQYNLPYRFVAWLQRMTEPLLFHLVHFSVDPLRCTLCKQCVRFCPTHNITYNKEIDRIIFKDNCTFCMRCYNLCPVYAIKAGKKTSLPPKYKRLEPIMKDFSYTELHKE
ncbi:MAG: EFR1 family ferrodoxin [Candidatus Thermoplasmatota archaeon]|nr:EFR1 family ferrodoxin [Candidatus Thermoplasmatota archaeon]